MADNVEQRMGSNADNQVEITVSAAVSAWRTLALQANTLTIANAGGDLYAVIKVMMPPKPDEKSAALWQQLAEAQKTFDPRKEWSKQNG